MSLNYARPDAHKAKDWIAVLRSVNTRVNWLAVLISSVVLTVMAFMTTFDVTLRAFGRPFPASVEISQLMEAWVIFLPFAYTLAMDRHVKVTIITMRLPRAWRLASNLFGLFTGMILFALMTWFSWFEFYHSWSINEFMMAAIILPYWLGKLAMPIGMALLTIQCVISSIMFIHEYRTGADDKFVLPAA